LFYEQSAPLRAINGFNHYCRERDKNVGRKGDLSDDGDPICRSASYFAQG
jgi:hypothetical protein